MKSLNTFDVLGATLTIVGSFLPWERGGGLLGPITNGVRVDVANFKYWARGIYEFPVYDYGGVLVILLTSVFILLVLQPPKFIRNPNLWNLIISAGLMASSLFFVGRGLIHLYEFGGAIERPALMFGLVCVVFGSVLLFSRALITYRKVTHDQSKSAGY
jgi:hypothetical protein